MPTIKKQVVISISNLELEEDRVWDLVATERDTKDAKFISHREVWT